MKGKAMSKNRVMMHNVFKGRRNKVMTTFRRANGYSRTYEPSTASLTRLQQHLTGYDIELRPGFMYAVKYFS